MNDPEREAFTENLPLESRETLLEKSIRPLDSTDNFTCHVPPGNAHVTWTAQYNQQGRPVNVVCWDTSRYNVNTTPVTLSRTITHQNGSTTNDTPLNGVYGFNPPFVDSSDRTCEYQYGVQTSGQASGLVFIRSTYAKPSFPGGLPAGPIDEGKLSLGEEQVLQAERERLRELGIAHVAEQTPLNEGKSVNELPSAQLNNTHLENPEG